jgi:hypothetical protein
VINEGFVLALPSRDLTGTRVRQGAEPAGDAEVVAVRVGLRRGSPPGRTPARHRVPDRGVRGPHTGHQDGLLNRGAITARICRLRDELVGPTPGDPGRSTRSSAVDALAFTGACYALQVYAREVGRHQIPLLWPWPRGLYRQHERGLELLLAAAMLLAEIERQDRATGTVTAGLTAVAGGAQ